MKRGVIVKQVFTLIWALIYGQLIGYIGSAVIGRPYSAAMAAMISVVFAVILWIIPKVMSTDQN